MLALECWHGDGDGDGCMDHGSMELDEPSWYTAQRRQAKRAIEATVWLRFATGSQSSCTILPWCNSYTHTSSEHISTGIPLVIGPLTYSCSNNFVRRNSKEEGKRESSQSSERERSYWEYSCTPGDVCNLVTELWSGNRVGYSLRRPIVRLQV